MNNINYRSISAIGRLFAYPLLTFYRHLTRK